MLKQRPRKILCTAILAASMTGLSTVAVAGVAECAAFPAATADKALAHLESASNLIQARSFRSRLKGRVELRRSLVDLRLTKLKLVGCGLLDQQYALFDSGFDGVDWTDINYLREHFDPYFLEAAGNFERHLIIGAVNILVLNALRESRGVFDIDARNDIEKALELLNIVHAELTLLQET